MVRNDSDTLIINTPLNTTNAVLQVLAAWRQDHLESYPTQESLFREMIVTQAKRIIRAKPTPSMQAQRDAIEAAKAAEDAEVDAAVQ